MPDTTFLQAAPAVPGSRASGGTVEDDYRIVAESTEIVNQLQGDFAERDRLYQQIDAVLFGQDPIKVPKAYQATAIEVRSPVAIHIVNTIAAALSVNAPSIQFQPSGFGDAAQENATEREHFFEASWERQEREAKRRLFRLGMWALVAYGECCWKTVERAKAAWGKYDARSREILRDIDKAEGRKLDQDAKDRIYDRRTEELKLGMPYPIRTTDVPPRTFYYLPTEDGLTLACEVKKLPYAQALAKYSQGLNGKGEVVPAALGLPREQWGSAMSGLHELKMLEVWTHRHVTYILQGPGQWDKDRNNRGTIVKRLRHGYGDPYTKALRGPYHHALGITTASRLPQHAGLGVLYGFLPLFPLLNSLLTIEAQVAYLRGFGAYKRKASPNSLPAPYGSDGAERDEPEVLTPGTIFPYDIEPIDTPRGPELIDKMIAMVMSLLQRALPDVLTGAVQDESGYALNQAAYLGRLGWDPIVDNAQVALGERVGWESWLVEHKIRERVYAWGESPKGKRGVKAGWLGIAPEDLGGVHRYQVRLDPETPSNRALEIRTHAAALDRRLESWEQAVEALGNNPDEVERAWLLWEIKQDPAVREALKARVWRKLGTLDRRRMAGAGAEMVGVPPGAGAPGQLGPGAPGEALGAAGQVFAPGMGMPEQPTPAGAVTGAGPRPMGGMIAGMQGGAGPGPGPGNPPGTPMQPTQLPTRHRTLPGQG